MHSIFYACAIKSHTAIPLEATRKKIYVRLCIEDANTLHKVYMEAKKMNNKVKKGMVIDTVLRLVQPEHPPYKVRLCRNRYESYMVVSEEAIERWIENGWTVNSAVVVALREAMRRYGVDELAEYVAKIMD